MDGDGDVSRWIQEFLLRKSENNGAVKRSLEVILFPYDDLRLKKTVLLGAVESELSDASVSETFLANLEILEELDHVQGFETLHSMKDAYCAVALECTVKYLVLSTARPGWKYLDAVKRIWRVRISEMEKSGKTYLLTDELKKCREEVEAAIFDDSLSKKFAAMNTRNDALRLVGVYLGEAWDLMGPAFLELAKRLMDEQNGDVCSYVNKVDARGSRNDQLCDKAAEEALASTSAGRELLAKECGVYQKEVDLPNMFVHKSVEPIAIADKSAEPSQSCANFDKSAEPTQLCAFVNKCASPIQSCDGLHLPSPKRKAVADLQNHEMEKPPKRREVKRWSLLEEDTLITGIHKYGEGNWKLILDSYREIFQRRKQVDLKDKWRNMKRYKNF